MLYRLLRGLSLGERIVPSGSIKRLGLGEEKIKKLQEVGAIAPVSAPPLSEIPGWQERARRLLTLTIFDADQFVEADVGRLAECLKTDVESVKEWQKEIIKWLQPEGKEVCCD